MTNLEQKLDRRSFLRGSSRFAAALGLAMVAPVSALAQSQEQQKPDEKKDEKKKEKDPDEALFDDPGNSRVTKIDENGREYRSCPQCGANMYRQGRTWTCENCGYSYVE